MRINMSNFSNIFSYDDSTFNEVTKLINYKYFSKSEKNKKIPKNLKYESVDSYLKRNGKIRHVTHEEYLKALENEINNPKTSFNQKSNKKRKAKSKK